MTKVLIGIDIDGTLTNDREKVSKKTKEYLTALSLEGYHIMFVTGRTFSWSMHLLSTFAFPFILACLNGAYITQMPEHRVIRRHALSLSIQSMLEKMLVGIDYALVILCDPEHNEASYLLAQNHSERIMNHLKARKVALKENWINVTSIQDIPVRACAAFRIFCLAQDAEHIVERIRGHVDVEVSRMRDSYDGAFTVVQITGGEASKGHALVEVAKYRHVTSKHIIACGDDRNDIPMLEKAHCRVVMSTATVDVLQHADIIAPPAKDDGLIVGIQKALQQISIL